MKHSGKPNPKLLAEVNAAIEKANDRSSGEFDGLFGSLPTGGAAVLQEILTYLRRYLLDEKGLAKAVSRNTRFSTAEQQSARFRIALQRRAEQDEGVRVAVDVLNSIASVLRVGDKYKLNGETFTKGEAVALLLSGRDGLQHRRHMERQRKYAREASKLRSEAREVREAVWVPIARTLREKYPDWSNKKLAAEVVKASKDVAVSVSTVRQMLPKHGLSKRP